VEDTGRIKKRAILVTPTGAFSTEMVRLKKKLINGIFQKPFWNIRKKASKTANWSSMGHNEKPSGASSRGF